MLIVALYGWKNIVLLLEEENSLLMELESLSKSILYYYLECLLSMVCMSP